jgi:hypothetical protein
MMFLPSSDDNSPAIDWLRLLDFLQVTIVAATTYLFFISSTFPLAGKPITLPFSAKF